MSDEMCRCGHSRYVHGDRDNRLEVVPLSMTEADEDPKQRDQSTVVRGEGPCTVEGCGCAGFDVA